MSSISCRDCPIRSLDVFRRFTGEELDFMQDFKSGELSVEAGTQLLIEGSKSPQLYTVLSGMALRYKLLENGRRQVINFVFPGDFVGLQSGLLGEMQHSVEAATDMELCVFRREDLWSLFRGQPSLAFDVTWMSAAEEHFLGESLVTLGQRDATQRIAWAVVKLYQRMQSVGLEGTGGVPFPFRQQDLADALGLSLVHTNKVLQSLRRRQLVTWTNGTLRVNDLTELANIAMITPEAPVERPLI
ncbi:Crp/Fnr family transcriptional regulator [Salipiger mucosus]|nr:Crp/Fnr family transcriptional regulator [Salipiger mucosus]